MSKGSKGLSWLPTDLPTDRGVEMGFLNGWDRKITTIDTSYLKSKTF